MAKSQAKTKVAILRAAIGLSLKEFADMVGKSPHTINSLESGRLKLSEDMAGRIFSVTGVAVHWLFNDALTGPPVRGDGKVLTRERFEYWYATISASWKKDARDAATSKARIIGGMLEEILDRDERKFWVAAYRADKFIAQLAKDFLPTKSAESKKREPETVEGVAQSIATKPETLNFEEVARAIADLVAMGMLPPNASKIKPEALEELMRRLEASGQLQGSSVALDERLLQDHRRTGATKSAGSKKSRP